MIYWDQYNFKPWILKTLNFSCSKSTTEALEKVWNFLFELYTKFGQRRDSSLNQENWALP